MCINNGYGGIIQWAITNQANANANMTAIAPFVPLPGTSTIVRQTQYEAPVSLFVNNNGMKGVKEIGYALPSMGDGAVVDLGVYNIKGALVKMLVHGPSDHGVFSVPFSAAGAYVVKLATNSKIQATKEIIVR
jgi:hypothetical protein